MMETRESLAEKVVKLTEKYKELQRAYREALGQIERLESENAELRRQLDQALRELREIERAIDSLLEE